MTGSPSTYSLVRSEHGFTLIELLVAMISSTVVAGALFAVLSFSTNETSTLADKVSSDQLGRIAMTRMINELHSACISPASVPIQEKSTESKLIFVNAYSNEAEIKSAEKHVIEYKNNTLVEKNYASTGGTWPSFAFTDYEKNEPTRTVTIAKNVSQNGPEGEKVPIFQYFSYNEETTESETAGVSTLNPTRLAGAKEPGEGLSSKEAASAAAVQISFNAASSDGLTTKNRSFNLSNEVTFAFSVPNAETPIHDAPCE
jgi:prepilin-type N-terminal cleavage/methylation domain-containing protein